MDLWVPILVDYMGTHIGSIGGVYLSELLVSCSLGGGERACARLGKAKGFAFD